MVEVFGMVEVRSRSKYRGDANAKSGRQLADILEMRLKNRCDEVIF